MVSNRDFVASFRSCVLANIVPFFVIVRQQFNVYVRNFTENRFISHYFDETSAINAIVAQLSYCHTALLSYCHIFSHIVTKELCLHHSFAIKLVPSFSLSFRQFKFQVECQSWGVQLSLMDSELDGEIVGQTVNLSLYRTQISGFYLRLEIGKHIKLPR